MVLMYHLHSFWDGSFSVYYRGGKPLIGIIFMAVCIVLGVISEMVFSGGILAPAYMIMVV